MTSESVFEIHEGISPFDMLFSVFGMSEGAAKFREKFTEFFANTPLADGIARTSLAKSLRLGVTILSAAIGGSSPQTIDAAKYRDAAKQMQAMMYEAGRSRADMMQNALVRPSAEQHQLALVQASRILADLRSSTKHEPGSPEQYAFSVVIANILDARTSTVLRDMLASNTEHDAAARWLTQQDVQADFSDLPTSHVMQDDTARTRFVDAMHELYDTPEIRTLQALVGDSRLLYNYECIFRAINQSGYREQHEIRVSRAAKELLAEGNLERVVEVLRGSGAGIPVEKIAGMIARYVPDSAFAHAHGEKVALSPETDEGLAQLQGPSDHSA